MDESFSKWTTACLLKEDETNMNPFLRMQWQSEECRQAQI
jgi:hypothetical protein